MPPPMANASHPLQRGIFLARVAAGLRPVRDVLRLGLVIVSGAAGGGLAVLVARSVLLTAGSRAAAPAPDGGGARSAGSAALWIAAAGVLGASIAGALAYDLIVRRT